MAVFKKGLSQNANTLSLKKEILSILRNIEGLGRWNGSLTGNEICQKKKTIHILQLFRGDLYTCNGRS
jgi:hypothetical protein